jgi:hypothetical protein
MILRSLTKHVKDQNWFAVGLDFAIVVLGVFIGIQVANWNDAQSAKERERRLLVELSSEIEQNSKRTRVIGDGLLVGTASARRILSVIENHAGCGNNCWPVVVDLMHASQWQRPTIRWTTYDELRRAGLPSDRRIIESVERHQTIYDRAIIALENAPAYRSLVRQLLPIDLQDRYWLHCFTTDAGSERYLYPCAEPRDSGQIDQAVIGRILDNSQLAMLLREWTSVAQIVGTTLVFDQSAAAQASINAIELTIGNVE